MKTQLAIDLVRSESAAVVPHVLPYQGSKRKLAATIARYFPARSVTMFEPFAGSAAMTLYAAHHNLAERFVIADKLPALVELHRCIVEHPARIADRYEEIWLGQPEDTAGAIEYFNRVRAEYGAERDAARLLFLIIRCVANAVRFNSSGGFSQSPDKRRRGTVPARLRESIFKTSNLLRGRTEFRVGDFAVTTADATPDDVVYMDPPYQGTSEGNDKRYFESLDRERLIQRLREMTARRVPFVLSYDGQHGDKTYGEDLPGDLHAQKLLVKTGRSTQGTLSGREVITYESVYISRHMRPAAEVPQREFAL